MKKIIILGASGYIGRRLIKRLLKKDYDLFLFNRNKNKLKDLKKYKNVHLYDLSLEESNKNELINIFSNADALFYLMHSMSEENEKDFFNKEKKIASFISNISDMSNVKQIIYLGGLGENNEKLSKHLLSRQMTGDMLRKNGKTPVTEFRAGIIIGAGGSSFEIIRTLGTKLPFIPVLFKNEGLCEPIFVDNIISYLKLSINNENYYNKILEIGSGEKYKYSKLIQIYAKEVLNKNLKIIDLSFLEKIISLNMVGRVISFMVRQPKELIIPLTHGVKNNAIVNEYDINKQIDNENRINRIIHLNLAYQLAADRENKCKVESVWDTPNNLTHLNKTSKKFFTTKEKEGMLYEEKYMTIKKDCKDKIFNEIKNIGKNGYWSYYWLWKIRGFIDRFFNGPGVSKNNIIHKKELHIGDRIDFWTIEKIKNNKKESELRLIAEMKTPGEAWLQFKIVKNNESKNTYIFYLRAFFEPKGIAGYLYWYSLYIIHKLIFRSMINNIYKEACLKK